MKLHVDKNADALYLRLDDSTIADSEEVAPGVVLDYNESNEVVGVEMRYLSKRSSRLKRNSRRFSLRSNKNRGQSTTLRRVADGVRSLISCPVNSHENTRVFFADGCVALPRVVHATRAGLKTRPYKSSRLADNKKSSAYYHAN